jgi:hypothetical protein
MINYLLGYGAFVLGSVLYLLSKIRDFKRQAKPIPGMEFNYKQFWNDELINIIQLYVGGIALVIFLPMMIGGATVDIKSTSGIVITTLALKATLIPMYFILGWSGNSALFSLFGKYKKTFLNQLGVEDETKNNNT